MRRPLRALINAIDWSMVLLIWFFAIGSTAILLWADAPTPIVALVFAGLGLLVVAVVPANTGRAGRRRPLDWVAPLAAEREARTSADANQSEQPGAAQTSTAA
jgi:hypothetical protein